MDQRQTQRHVFAAIKPIVKRSIHVRATSEHSDTGKLFTTNDRQLIQHLPLAPLFRRLLFGRSSSWDASCCTSAMLRTADLGGPG